MISTRKALWLLLATAVLIVLVTGCNDTLRQFITPVPAPGGDPGALSHAIVLSTNPATPTASNPALGSDLHIDVSGDSVVGVVPVGPLPKFLGKTTNKVFVLNGDGTVTSYLALLPQSTPISTVTLPPGTVAQGGGFSNSGNFYVVNSGTAPPSPSSSNNVGVISASVSAITATIPVGTNPVAVAGNNANNKIYVVNQGSGNATGNVTVVSTIDNFVIGNIQVGTSPVWGVMAPDGVHVFIVNQGSNDVSVIDTLLDQVIATIPVGTSPNYAVFEPTNQRLYVSNTGSPTISVIKANGIDLAQGILPTKIAEIPIPAAADSIAALADGSRAYAAMGGCPAGTNHTTIIANLPSCTGNQVAVIDTQALALRKVLTVGLGAVSIDAANNSSRVYVISANDITTITSNVPSPQPSRTFATPSVSIINTASDTVLRQTVDPSITSLVPTFHVPQQDPACVPTIDSSFNTKVPLPCPEQAPFVVRIVP
ncbi:MAG TPA: YncE family protein [Candidatus Angelobacter sp.]|nr:YncE family protein [Candidatus Angelobacter sp.]